MQTAETPPSCSLPPDALRARPAWLRQIATRLTAHDLRGNTLRLTYQLQAKQELQRIVAEERLCCSFLDFTLQELPDRVDLTIRAPAEAGSVATQFFEHFLPTTQQTSPRQACGCAPGACG